MRAVIVWTAAVGLLAAQPPPGAAPLNVPQAVERALRNYPSIEVSQAQLGAAAGAIRLARTAYLPRVDGLAQVNRATRNNVFGLLLPQSALPAISGPVLGTNNFGTAWGSAVGVLVTWEPFDFGLRRANVALASAARLRSEAALERTRFEVAAASADACLTLVAAEETFRAAQAGVERAATVLKTIAALADAELRPGADRSRAEAELAAARTQEMQARQAVEVARATVAQFLGLEPAAVEIAAPRLLASAPAAATAPFDPGAHPAALEQNGAIEEEKARLATLDHSYAPRFELQGAAYARGTSAETDGRLLGGLNGLAPSVQNYALGLTVTFPAFDLPALRAREAVENATIRAQTALYRQIQTELRAQWNRAVASYEGARDVAANTPTEVSSARAAAAQATARYQSGLGNIDEVAEAQRLLTQAEIDDALARLGVWRAWLGMNVARGDIAPFLAEAGR